MAIAGILRVVIILIILLILVRILMNLLWFKYLIWIYLITLILLNKSRFWYKYIIFLQMFCLKSREFQSDFFLYVMPPISYNVKSHFEHILTKDFCSNLHFFIQIFPEKSISSGTNQNTLLRYISFISLTKNIELLNLNNNLLTNV